MMEKGLQTTGEKQAAQDDDLKHTEAGCEAVTSVEPTAVWSAKEERMVKLKYVFLLPGASKHLLP